MKAGVLIGRRRWPWAIWSPAAVYVHIYLARQVYQIDLVPRYLEAFTLDPNFRSMVCSPAQSRADRAATKPGVSASAKSHVLEAVLRMLFYDWNALDRREDSQAAEVNEPAI